MTIPAEATLAFAGYVLDARKRLLIGPGGAPIGLSSRAFDTLHYLARHPHDLIDKQQLMSAVWPHSVVEENNLNQQISMLRKVFGEQRFIVTISGRGYKFVQEVCVVGPEEPLSRAAAASPPGAMPCAEPSLPTPSAGPSLPTPSAISGAKPPALPEVTSLAPMRAWRAPWSLGAIGPLVLFIGACAFFAQREWGLAAPARAPSIAVLPFADVSAGHDQAYFADGLSEELLNALGRLNGLRVIGRTSSFSFKDRNDDVRHVAATLGVQHVLEGSVRRDGNRLRISAQLVDATSGSQLWAETYDRTLGDVFAIQKEIADSVASTLQVTFRPARVAALAGGTRNVEAYEAYLAARAVTNNEGSNRSREAIELLERAVRLDPDFAMAWAALAENYTFAADFPRSMALPLTPIELQQRISSAALRAVELAPDSPQSLRSAGMVSMQNRDWVQAERRLHRAADLAGPYDYDANLTYALFLMNVGRPDDANAYVERAIRAEPLLMRPVTFMAALYEMRGELDKAAALIAASRNLKGSDQMRRQALLMIRLGRQDHNELRYVTDKDGNPCLRLDDADVALPELRKDYTDAMQSGVHAQLIPVALFASFLGDQSLALNALRAMVPTQNLFPIWRPALRDMRRASGFEGLVKELGLVDYWRASGKWSEFCRDDGHGSVTCR